MLVLALSVVIGVVVGLLGAVEISRIATVRAAKDRFLMPSKVLLAYRSCIESILHEEVF